MGVVSTQSTWGGLCMPMPCGPCAQVSFDLKTPDGRVVGGIRKKISCCKWLFAPDVDSYSVDFGGLQNSADKVLVMALAIFMDFKYFSNNEGNSMAQDAVQSM